MQFRSHVRRVSPCVHRCKTLVPHTTLMETRFAPFFQIKKEAPVPEIDRHKSDQRHLEESKN